jgi:hypothetical protein
MYNKYDTDHSNIVILGVLNHGPLLSWDPNLGMEV